MGKNKKGKKAATVSTDKKPGGVKKHKAKPVATNLKRLNQINKTKTECLDKNYSGFRNSVIKSAQESKKAKNKPAVKEQVHPVRDAPKPTPDIDETMMDLSKL